MRLFLICLVFLFMQGWPPAIAQGKLSQVTRVEATGNFIEVDPLGNCYVVKDYEIEKYNSAGKLEYTYSNFITGKISAVDASDPFKIMVFYQDFGQVNILDNTLSETADPMLLQAYGLGLASVVCRSYNTGMWVFDPQSLELVRFNDNMEITDRTGNISQVLGIPVDPETMTEVENMVYIYDPSEGVISFDRYGTYYRTYPFTGITTFQVAGNRIVYLTGNELQFYDTRRLSGTSMKLPVNGVKDAKISYNLQPEQLFVLDNGHLYIFVKN